MFFFFKQKTAYEMRISDWSSDVCSSDLLRQITDAADRLHRLVILEIGLQCHRGRDAVALDQRHRLREDAPVQRLDEMHAIELYRQVLDDSIVDQDRAQKGGFRLDIAGQLAFVPGRDEGGEAGDGRKRNRLNYSH